MLVSRMETWRFPWYYMLLPLDMTRWAPTSDSQLGLKREDMEILVPTKAIWHTPGYHPLSLFDLAELHSWWPPVDDIAASLIVSLLLREAAFLFLRCVHGVEMVLSMSTVVFWPRRTDPPMLAGR